MNIKQIINEEFNRVLNEATGDEQYLDEFRSELSYQHEKFQRCADEISGFLQHFESLPDKLTEWCKENGRTWEYKNKDIDEQCFTVSFSLKLNQEPDINSMSDDEYNQFEDYIVDAEHDLKFTFEDNEVGVTVDTNANYDTTGEIEIDIVYVLYE